MTETANAAPRRRLILDEEIEALRAICVSFSGPRYKLQQWAVDSEGKGVWRDVTDKNTAPAEVNLESS